MTAAWEQVCRVEELVPGRPVGKVVGDSGQDRDRVCVVLTGEGEHVAMLDRCPHRDIALSGGIVKDGTLVCPGHFWRFDLLTGERTDLPDGGATLYPTRVVDGWVEAMVPPPEPRRSMREWLLAEARGRSNAMESANPANPEIGETVDVHGIRTNYQDVGTGAPVVLIHGSGPGVSAWANWRLTLPSLSERFRVLAPDILGFGYTERPDGTTYNLDTWTNHLVGFLDALGLERVSLVGNSFGGALALSLTTRFPQRVDRLVLMGSVGVPFDLTPGLDAVWGFEPSLPNMRALLDIFAHDRTLVDDDLARLRLEAATRPGVQEAYRAMFPAPRQASVDAMTIDADLIRAIEQPTLLVHGRDDQVIPLANSLRLHKLIDNSQLHVFGRCGHWVQIEHAEAFNRMVSNFLELPH
ncbi:alpha/beta fold hydrolase [Nocardioides speluncae]|uniref:alpha/beta fold hydrolase n=1 Tax=Nocardioides speluncae TaxID=2670337 RepID=UPI0013799DE9|nr:alpha/beta fold hydrolase [Nocardioides speluncae]